MKLSNKCIIILLSLTFCTCQKEESLLVQNTNNNTIKYQNPLLNLLIRVAQNPTSFDNVLDNSSCFQVKLPVNVVVNSQSLNIISESNFNLITDAQNNFSGDDVVYFQFPISIAFQNSNQEMINNQTEFDQIKNNCDLKNNFLSELNCVKFVFPLAINAYNTSNDQANTLVFNNNNGIFNFLNNLKPDNLIEINYPISLLNSNNQNITINTNKELKTFIESQINNCNGTSSGVLNPNLTNYLTTGTWIVSYFYEDDDDETGDFVNYKFVFNTNNTISINDGVNTSIGTWSVYFENGATKINLSFADSNLADLNKIWRLLELNANIIEMREDNIDEDNYLIIRKL